MNATKYTMTIVVEVLSIDSIPALINRVSAAVMSEALEGTLTMNDGDSVSWSVESKPIGL